MTDAGAMEVVETSGGADGTYTAPLHPSGQLRALLFEEVTNTDELRAKLMSGELPEFALVNPDVVASTFHLLLAASTALMYERANALHVKTLHAELIYALAPSCNISEAFRVFGAGKGDTKVLVAFIDAPPEAIAQVAAAIKGRQVEDVAAYFDTRPLPEERVARLRKVFKLGGGQNQGQGGKKGGKKANKGGGGGGGGGSGGQEEEAAAEDLEHAIISRVAAKHVS